MSATGGSSPVSLMSQQNAVDMVPSGDPQDPLPAGNVSPQRDSPFDFAEMQEQLRESLDENAQLCKMLRAAEDVDRNLAVSSRFHSSDLSHGFPDCAYGAVFIACSAPDGEV